VEVPQQQMNSIEEVKNIPVSTTSGGTTLPLRNIANVQNSVAAGEYDRFNSQRMITLTANISGADLGSVASQLTTAMKQAGAPPAKVNSEIRGQIVPFRQMFTGLEAGLLLAVVVIFLLLAANYQSWKLAFVVTSTRARGYRRRRDCALGDADHAEYSIVHGRNHGHRRGRCECNLLVTLPSAAGSVAKNLTPLQLKARAAGCGQS